MYHREESGAHCELISAWSVMIDSQTLLHPASVSCFLLDSAVSASQGLQNTQRSQ